MRFCSKLLNTCYLYFKGIYNDWGEWALRWVESGAEWMSEVIRFGGFQ